MISIENLSFSYRKKEFLFRNLNLELNPGSITGLLGKNGAGKTSLLKIITGLRFQQEGTINVLEHNPKNREVSLLEKIFFVPEEFYLPTVSVRRYITSNYVFYPLFDKEMMEKLLAEFEIPSSQSIQQLSYGQKKKFLISFTLATKCKLLILDEPTNGLDIPSKAIFRKVLAGNLEEDQLCIISTHQVRDVENLIDRILILDDGNIILNKDNAEISSKLQFTKSSVPESESILYSETSPGGYKVIKSGINGSSHIDIELLFNAITRGNKILN